MFYFILYSLGLRLSEGLALTVAVAKQLHAWARSPGQTIELLLQDGRRFSVIFRMGWGAGG